MAQTPAIRAIAHIFFLCIVALGLSAQRPELYRAGKHWGYQRHGEICIQPQYDTAFAFDATGTWAMVGQLQAGRKVTDQLTGEEQPVITYYFIKPDQTKLKLGLSPSDSVSGFPPQQELTGNYLLGNSVFKVLYDQKVWLFTRDGHQLSSGYDNIYPADSAGQFYITEHCSTWDQEIVHVKGLIDRTGKLIVPCEKKHISINNADSLIYTCSTVFNRRLADEVFDFGGRLVYANKNHIEFAAKGAYVYKIYEPKEMFIVNNGAKDLYGIEGKKFSHLGNNKALVAGADTWLVINLQTGKKQKVSQDAFLAFAFNLLLCL